jgi:hypothetical protein
MAAALSELEQQNANIRSQIETWQQQRIDNGQAPTDWNAFRQHAMAIGAPDPGQEEPREFMESAAAAENRASSIKQQAQQAQASQQVQAPQQQVQQPTRQQQAPQPIQPMQPPQQQRVSPELLEALRIKNDYEADKKTPTDKWLKARGMTQAQLDAALKLAASA